MKRPLSTMYTRVLNFAMLCGVWIVGIWCGGFWLLWAFLITAWVASNAIFQYESHRYRLPGKFSDDGGDGSGVLAPTGPKFPPRVGVDAKPFPPLDDDL